MYQLRYRLFYILQFQRCNNQSLRILETQEYEKFNKVHCTRRFIGMYEKYQEDVKMMARTIGFPGVNYSLSTSFSIVGNSPSSIRTHSHLTAQFIPLFTSIFDCLRKRTYSSVCSDRDHFREVSYPQFSCNCHD